MPSQTFDELQSNLNYIIQLENAIYTCEHTLNGPGFASSSQLSACLVVIQVHLQKRMVGCKRICHYLKKFGMATMNADLAQNICQYLYSSYMGDMLSKPVGVYCTICSSFMFLLNMARRWAPVPQMSSSKQASLQAPPAIPVQARTDGHTP